MDDWVCLYMISFEDGSREGQVLYRGTQQDCERMGRLLPGVAYAGDKKAVDCRMHVAQNQHDLETGQIVVVTAEEATTEGGRERNVNLYISKTPDPRGTYVEHTDDGGVALHFETVRVVFGAEEFDKAAKFRDVLSEVVEERRHQL